MKKFKFSKQTIKVLCLGTALASVMFMNSFSFASSDETLQTLHTKDFIEWQKLSDEEKENTLMPKMYTTNVDDEILQEYDKKEFSYRMQILTRKISEKLYSAMTKAATYNVPAYNLKNDINIQIKDQASTNECWAFSTVTMLETNLALTKSINKTFSPRHMDYSTLKTFTDGTNPYGYNREAGSGGLAPFGLAYLTNGKGAVLESEMPFVDSGAPISLSELNKPVDTIVSDYVSLPTVYKEYAENGDVTYTNGGVGENRKVYTKEEVTQIRNVIKDHIVKYGAVSSVTAANHAEFYNNKSNPFKASAFFCNNNLYPRDHAVTIVGWDDTYSKDNFGDIKPKTDGAYICTNTYGTESFDKGYIYISYEDSLIESLLYGIQTTSNVDYDNLYQYNPMGDNTALGINTKTEGYIASVYNRDASKDETLTYVGVAVPQDSSLEIYVNPKGNSTTLSGLTKVATTGVLKAGYHRINVDDIKLTGNSFAVVVKQTSASGTFYFSIEACVPNSLYSTITGNPGYCLYSLDGYTWKNLSTEPINGFDMKNTDLCIKAFTDVKEEKPVDPTPTEPDTPTTPSNPDDVKPEEPADKITLSSNNYLIKDSDIYKITNLTTFSKFKSQITTNSKTIVVTDKNGTEIKDTDYIKTGMKMKLSDGTTYTLIVRGDVDGCGNVTILDFSKFLAHYCYGKEFTLAGDYIKAADMNFDMKIETTDFSQMVDLYMNT